MDLFETVISILLMAFIITDISAAYLLVRGAARSSYSILALNERAFVASVQGVSATMLGMLGANRIFGWHWSSEFALFVLSVAILIQASPSIIWLWLYLTNRFNSDGGVKEKSE
jgi:hypothetical protein